MYKSCWFFVIVIKFFLLCLMNSVAYAQTTEYQLISLFVYKNFCFKLTDVFLKIP
jgi:hypothetical protein